MGRNAIRVPMADDKVKVQIIPWAPISLNIFISPYLHISIPFVRKKKDRQKMFNPLTTNVPII